MCGKFVCKHSETIEYVKNQPTFKETYKLHGCRNVHGIVFV